jgi:surface antigen
MLRYALIPALLATSLAVPMPAAASLATRQSVTGQNCAQAQEPARQRRRSIFGAIAGNVIGQAIGSNSVGRVVGSVVPVGSMLTDAIMNMLDCDEQQKAAEATTQAVNGEVGSTVEWESATRSGVRGRSTVTAEAPTTADGRQCRMVTNVVIVDGEETEAQQRMCRQPPSMGYVRV